MWTWVTDFNPRAPCGARLTRYRSWLRATEFQSTRPVRGATCAASKDYAELVFQSTRPVRGATIAATVATPTTIFQSTRPVRGATMM